MRPLSLMGKGFIGSNYVDLYPEDVFVEDRSCVVPWPLARDVLYTISTTSNYGPINGDLNVDIDTNLGHLVSVLPNVRGEFNFLSSWFVYGFNNWGHHPAWRAKEEHLCNPNGYYSITKYAAELLVRSHCHTAATGLIKGPTGYRILRLSNVIGNDPRASKQKNAFEYLLQKVLAGQDVSVYEGDNYRDTLHVEDVCRAINLCITDTPVNDRINNVINIGRGESHRLEDLLQYAIDKTGSTSKIVRVPVPEFHKVVQVPDFFMDTAKLRGLGFEPKYSIWESIDKVIAGLSP